MAVIALVEEEIKPKTRKKAPAKPAKAKAAPKVDITKAESKAPEAAPAAGAEKPAA